MNDYRLIKQTSKHTEEALSRVHVIVFKDQVAFFMVIGTKKRKKIFSNTQMDFS